MKITIELDTAVAAEKALLTAWLGAAPVAAEENNTAEPAAEENNTAETPRLYGEAPEGKKRRTKAEIEQDEAIEKLFAQAKELGAAGLPKTIPADPADELHADLEAMLDVLKDADDDDDAGFEVDEPDTPTSEDPMDLDEFRAILTKGVKELGGKDVGALMKPYKSATDVPEDERNDYAQKLRDALN